MPVPLKELVDISTQLGANGFIVLFLYLVYKKLSRIEHNTMLLMLEHETLMNWWQEHHPGQPRPAEQIAKAKKLGINA